MYIEEQIENAIIDTIEYFNTQKKAFTSVDITTKIRENGLTVRTSEVSAYLKQYYKTFLPSYKKSYIDIGDGHAIKTAILYHPEWMDSSDYKPDNKSKYNAPIAENNICAKDTDGNVESNCCLVEDNCLCDYNDCMLFIYDCIDYFNQTEKYIEPYEVFETIFSELSAFKSTDYNSKIISILVTIQLMYDIVISDLEEVRRITLSDFNLDKYAKSADFAAWGTVSELITRDNAPARHVWQARRKHKINKFKNHFRVPNYIAEMKDEIDHLQKLIS